MYQELGRKNPIGGINRGSENAELDGVAYLKKILGKINGARNS